MGRPSTLPATKRTRGTGKADVIAGRRAGERIAVRGGRDRVCAKGGRDRVKGGPGRDRIDCGKGRDVAIAGPRDKLRRCERVRRG